MIRTGFMGMQAAKKGKARPKTEPKYEVKKLGILGAGMMGAGIAYVSAKVGMDVVLKDVTMEGAEKGKAYSKMILDKAISRKRSTPEKAEALLSKIQPTDDPQAMEGCDMVIEAVFEDMGVKKVVFQALDKYMKPGAILATNTSTLDGDQIAQFTKRAADVIGTHFFSPANVMKLLEVVRGEATAKDVLATTMNLAKRIRKTAVVSGVCDGFIGNRMLEKYSRQSREVVLEGSTPWGVDQALQGFGMAMGPYRMYDVVGVDLGWRSRQLAGLGRGEPIVWLDNKLCEMERFGQKSGHGFYKYEQGSRQAIHDPKTDMMAREVAEEAGYTARDVSADEIVNRCILALVNEGARILDEGYAESAEDIDRVYRFGYGFPAERGGPMAYADSLGLDKVLAEIRALEAERGEFWKPAAGLVKLAEAGGRFTKA